jgi:site-specific DNA recombinase
MVKNRAAIYARFSSHNQRSESIEIQVENSRTYCEREGLQVVREYCDYAQTGRNVNRAEFQRMMNDAKLGLFDYVVIYKVTRIMRNRDEMALARIMLRKAGVEILYAGEEIASGSSGVLQLGMLEVLAEWESAIDSERIRDGIQKNAARCLANGHSLYGWDIVDGRYSVNEREAALMRKMKNMLFSGHSVADIVRALEGEKTRNGKPFNQDKVTKLLRRVQNGGTYSYAGHVVEGGMPGLWPQVEQDMIESVLNDRHRPRRKVDSSKEFPLSGKLYCTKCGMPMAGMSGTSKTGKAYHYYRCRKCRRTVRRDLIEDAVVDMTLQAVARDDVRQRIAQGMALYQSEQEETKPESYYLKKELRRIDAAFERIWQAIEDGIAPPGGKERTDELKRRKAEIEAQLRIAERGESMSFGVDELMLWLDEIATELTPLDILNKFVRFAEIDGKSNRIRVYFAFDKHGDGFSPNSADKGEHLYEERCSPNSTLVELMRKTANSTGTANRSAIQLDTCIVRVSKNWFVVVGTCQK